MSGIVGIELREIINTETHEVTRTTRTPTAIIISRTTYVTTTVKTATATKTTTKVTTTHTVTTPAPMGSTYPVQQHFQR